MYTHVPVLLEAAMRFLAVKPEGAYVDCTLGGGGYTERILELSAPLGPVLSIDVDAEAIKHFQESGIYKSNKSRITLVHGNFRDLGDIVVKHEFTGITGIVADIGMSSFQLDQSDRGISFQKNELLDMRFDQTSPIPTASFLLNNKEESEIKLWFKDFGEEPFAGRIAKKIVAGREKKSLHSTADLVEIIKSSLPAPIKHKWTDHARRVFQALRIAVNKELTNLEELLPKAFDILAPGGRLVIVTFHSLEDRIVKNYFVGLSKACVCPSEFPMCICGKNPRGKILTKKPLIPDEDEIINNPRSKPAKLRAIEKIQ